VGTLSALVAVPFVGALAVACVGRTRTDVLRAVVVATLAVELALAAYVVSQFDAGNGGFQFVVNTPWIQQFGISWHLGIDGISLWLVALTAILFPIAAFGPPIKHDPKPYLAWLLILQGGVMGSFLSLDLFLFFVFFELVLVPMYFLIAGWGYDKRAYASLKFFLYTLFGSAFLLVAIVSLAVLHERATGVLTFDLIQLGTGAGLTTTAATLLFFAFAIGFGVKVPLFPLHTWLPDAHTQAPTAGSVILAGVMLKLGTYGFLRFSLYLFPQQSADYAWVLLTLATIGIVYTAIVAAMQKDLKRLIAYSSVAHLGFIVLGTFALTRQGISGAVLQNINHGVSTGALFLMVGMISDRRHTRSIAELKGILKVAPVMGGVFLLVVLSSIGVPGLNGFVGEFSILLGTFISHRWFAVVAATGVILAAVYMLWAYQRSFHGSPDQANSTIKDLTTRERVQLAPLLILIVGMGLFPKPFLDRINPTVNNLIAHIESRSDYREPQRANEAAPEATGEHSGHSSGADHGSGETK